MKRKNKTRFFNLAEQLTLQNDIVNSTMDSMLQFVSNEETAEERSDFTEIQKTAKQICEMNPTIDSQPTESDDVVDTRRAKSLPRPKNVASQEPVERDNRGLSHKGSRSKKEIRNANRE